jgi:hypothetical protein
MSTQKLSSRFEIDSWLVQFVRLPGVAERPVEYGKHRVNRGQDVRFRAPERREARSREPHLQRSEVAATQRHVLQEVHSALPLTRVDLLENVNRLPRKVNQIPPDLKNFVDQLLELTVAVWLTGVPRRQRCHHSWCLSQRYERRVTYSRSVANRDGSAAVPSRVFHTRHIDRRGPFGLSQSLPFLSLFVRDFSIVKPLFMSTDFPMAGLPFMFLTPRIQSGSLKRVTCRELVGI